MDLEKLSICMVSSSLRYPHVFMQMKSCNGYFDDRLLSKGYALEEIVAAVMEVEVVKKSRAESLRLSNREKLSVVIDSAGRTLRKIVGNSKREEPHTVQARMA